MSKSALGKRVNVKFNSARRILSTSSLHVVLVISMHVIDYLGHVRRNEGARLFHIERSEPELESIFR